VVHLEGVNEKHWRLLLVFVLVIAKSTGNPIHFKNISITSHDLVLLQSKAVLITDELDVLANIRVIL
jgi:hypothetical protein